MKKVLLSLAAVTAIAAAAPAAAQSYRIVRVDTAASINQHQADIARKIDNGFRRGLLTGAEANRLSAQLRQIEAIERHYRRGGLNWRERADLDARLDRLQAQLRLERRDVDRRYGHGARW